MPRIIKPCSMMFLLALAACGTSPEPDLYTLAPVTGTVTPGIVDTIKIVRPDLPPFLDRPDFVSQITPYQISLNETANWSEPLATMFERTLADDVQQRLPMASIETDADDDTSPKPRYIIETKIQQFNPTNYGQIILRADLQLTDLNARTQPPAHHITLNVDHSSMDPAAIAAALSTLLGQYADQITASLSVSQ